jgi:thioredoxin reductase (NADPH)
MEQMRKQAVHHGARVVSELVKQVQLEERPFRIVPNYSAPITAHTVLVATGAAAKWIGLENELRLATSGGGVSACAVCDGALPRFRNKPIVVVGGGDSAVEEATYLTRFASKVYLIHSRDTLRASRIMAERTLANPKIEMVWDSVVTEVTDVAADKVTGVKLKNLKTGAESHLPCTGVFVAIGHVPNTSLFKGTLDLHENGYFKTDGTVRTTIPGVFVAGDCVDSVYRQAITAAGLGCSAAIEAERHLAGLNS